MLRGEGVERCIDMHARVFDIYASVRTLRARVRSMPAQPTRTCANHACTAYCCAWVCVRGPSWHRQREKNGMKNNPPEV